MYAVGGPVHDSNGKVDAVTAVFATQGGRAGPQERCRLPGGSLSIRTIRRCGSPTPRAQHPVIDEPASFIRDRARLREAVRLMSAEGSRLHLIGVGGDELFGAYPSYLRDLFIWRTFMAWTTVAGAAPRHVRIGRRVSGTPRPIRC